MELRYRIVDVFSDRPLAGNALCVVLDPCPEPVMAAVAREVNLSETTFPVVVDDGVYEMRIFTPAAELPFAGHPSLGTAWCLGARSWTQVTEGATVRVDASESGAVMTQPDPVITPAGDQAALGALGLPRADAVVVAEAGGVRHVIVATPARIDGLLPDLAALGDVAKRSRAVTVAAVHRLDDTTLHVRVFAPGVGIGEDPGTGAAAGPIAVMARELWGTATDVTIAQGAEIGRPSRIEVHAERGSLRVGGRVSACAEGVFTL